MGLKKGISLGQMGQRGEIVGSGDRGYRVGDGR